jgi:chromosome transmission fidelity protein 18
LDYLFNNEPHISYIDPTLDRCATAHEWLSAADAYRSVGSGGISGNSNSGPAVQMMMQYMHIPTTAMALHLLCRVERRPELQLSNKDMFFARFQAEANLSLLKKFLEGLSPSVKAGSMSLQNLTQEALSFILWTLSAGNYGTKESLNRAVTTKDMLNRDETQAFDAHVSKLSSLGLTYVSDISSNNSPQEENGETREDEDSSSFGGAASKSSFQISKPMRLEPEIDQLISYHQMSRFRSNRRRYIPDVVS